MKRLFFYLLSLLLFVNWACNKDDTNIADEPPQISSFVFEDFDQPVEGEIDHENGKIEVIVPSGTDLSSLTPTVSFTNGAVLNPPAGYSYNFSDPLRFTLSKGEYEVVYEVVVSHAESDENQLLGVDFPGLYRSGSVENEKVKVDVPYGTDLGAVNMNFRIPDLATVEPSGENPVDIEEGLDIVVTAENGDEKIYELVVNEMPQDVGVRAFWIPAPWHSTFLKSYENIKEGVQMAVDLNFNTLYVVAWSQTKILYPSPTLVENSAYETTDEALLGNYEGGSGDPLTDLIEVAHENDLKVILWYEYGFMARHSSAPTPENDKILAVHPDWVGINNDGNESHYNGSDYYYNAYNPEVQRFMLDMMLEAVNNYDIDGIQGDDRLPAMPRNSGYDSYTVDQYKNEHSGQEPPDDPNDGEWVQWRADILNDFAVQMYDEIKAADPECIVGFSPNPYPWAFDNLMQDWPAWLDEGIVEILSVQCYRTDVTAYEYTIDEVLTYYENHGTGNLDLLSPGLILYGSSGRTDPEVLAGEIKANRDRGITGESFFYDEPLKNEKLQKVIRAFYPAPAIFPEMP